LLGISVFALGSISGQLNVIVKLLALLLFLPKILIWKFKLNEILIFLFFSLTALYQILSNPSATIISLEISFLLNVFLLVLINKLKPTKSSRYDRLAYNFFLISCILQITFFYFINGDGTLLRGDRNHSAVILTVLMFSFAYFYKHINLIGLLVLINQSRNFLVGIIVFLFRDFITTIFHKRKYIMFSVLFCSLFAISYLYFFFITYLEITNIGSENNLSRLLVIFDGSNSTRFMLNNVFIEMIIKDWSTYLIYTGVYSDLIEIQGLYPHNSFLQTIYRVGLLRAFMYFLLIITFVNKYNTSIIVALFFQSMFIHDILLSNVLLLAFVTSKFYIVKVK
jgi:hypothetical protein